MRLAWSKRITDDSPWEPEYSGVFFSQDSHVTFFYKNGGDIRSLSRDGESKIVNSRSVVGPVSLPDKWRIFKEDETAYLVIDKNNAIDLARGISIRDIPPAVREAYGHSVKPEYYFEQNSFTFGEYCIAHEGQCGYLCKKNEETVWRFKGRAYLYTDMVLWDDLLLFGTAGNGGYFYVLNINSGEPLLRIKTGGTTGFVHVDNLCFVLQGSGESRLLCIDLSSKQIKSQCDLPGSVTEYSKIELIGNHIHAITFTYLNKKLVNANWNCCDISAEI